MELHEEGAGWWCAADGIAVVAATAERCIELLDDVLADVGWPARFHLFGQPPAGPRDWWWCR